MTITLEGPPPVPASDELDDFEFFCSKVKLQQRNTWMLLEDFQKVYLNDHLTGSQVTVVIQPKKLAKTTTVAALALYHALTVDEPNVVIVARSVNQAKYMYRQMQGMVLRNPWLAEAFDVRAGFNEIRTKKDGGLGVIKVYANGESNLEGVEPTLGIIDEYGQFSDSAAYGILNDGIGTRHGQLIVISNAGDDEDGPLGKLRTLCYEHLIGRWDAYRYCRKPDASLNLHEWALDAHEDWTDLRIVKKANPASWMTPKELERRRGSEPTDKRFKRFACGIWAQPDEAALSAHEWDGYTDPTAVIPSHAPVVVGLDMGSTGDPTAIVPMWWQSDTRRVIGDPVVFEPPGVDGQGIAYLAVELALLGLAGKLKFDRSRFLRDLVDTDTEAVEAWADTIESIRPFTVGAITYDPWHAGQLAEQMTRKHKLTFVEFKQRPEQLVRADGRFVEAFSKGHIVHNGNTVMRAHALNAVEIASGGYFYFGRLSKGPRKPMDALRAVSMAHDTAVAHGSTLIKPRRRRAFALPG